MSKGNTNLDIGGEENDEVVGGGDVDVQMLLEASGVFSRLVPDIFLDIMSRVPMKSLSQCRWVCKSWYKLIKSPGFAKTQYKWAVQNNSPWVFFWCNDKILYLVDDQVFDNRETTVTARRLELNGFDQALEFFRVFETAGYINGLLCLASDPLCYHPSSIYICNPITGEHIIIPKSPKYKRSAISSFGFDPVTDKYKVVRIMHYKDKDGEYLSSEGEVYTLGSSEWRRIEDVPQDLNIRECGILVNGNLHWISRLSNSLIFNVFNVGSEKFDVIELPYMFQKDNSRNMVGMEEGHLCMLHWESPCNHYEIWVMKDYGVQSSWVKKYSFKSCLRTLFWYGSNDLIKLRDGEFLLQYETGNGKECMGYFDPKKDTLRPIRIIGDMENDHWRSCFQSVVQVGSLFSPKNVGKSRK